MEFVVLLVGSVALGVIRPRWTTLLAALVPAALAFAWLVLHEDVPGDPLGFGDLAWYVGMSLLVGGAFALAIAAGLGAARLGAARNARGREGPRT